MIRTVRSATLPENSTLENENTHQTAAAHVRQYAYRYMRQQPPGVMSNPSAQREDNAVQNSGRTGVRRTASTPRDYHAPETVQRRTGTTREIRETSGSQETANIGLFPLEVQNNLILALGNTSKYLLIIDRH